MKATHNIYAIDKFNATFDDVYKTQLNLSCSLCSGLQKKNRFLAGTVFRVQNYS